MSGDLAGAAARLLEGRTSRRGLLIRLAVAGSAIAVAPLRYLLRPGTAMAVITCSQCGGGARCCDGWTDFCCVINNGINACPSYTYIAGWWKCTNYTGTNICHSQGVRYYIDCNRKPGMHCPHGCSCANGSCSNRSTCCNVFKYGQCNTQVPADDGGRLPGDQVREPVHAVPRHLQLYDVRGQQHLRPRRAVPEDRSAAGLAVHGPARRRRGRVRMTALVVVETILLVLLSVLVVGLLRSHAEILRRLESGDVPQRSAAPELAIAQPRDDAPAPADVGGVTLGGDAVQIAVGAPGTRTLLAFLTSGCSVCGGFWQALREGAAASAPGGARVVIVTRDSSMESPSRLRDLAPADLPVIMSSQAWEDYRVPLAPYFVLLDGGSGTVEGEGAAESWPQVASLLRDAMDDQAEAERHGDRVERDLASAGIGADHASLYSAQVEAGD